MNKQIKVLAFAGGLRRGSYNKALVRCALEECPSNLSIEVFDLEGIPPYNADNEQTPPQSVKDFKDRIRQADALLMATPEYNYPSPVYSKMLLTGQVDPKRAILCRANQ